MHVERVSLNIEYIHGGPPMFCDDSDDPTTGIFKKWQTRRPFINVGDDDCVSRITKGTAARNEFFVCSEFSPKSRKTPN